MTVNKININNRGVTLLELMVSISIFSLMLVAVFSVSSNVITGQREAIALQDASENIRYFMEVASKEIRMTRGNKDGVDAQFLPPFEKLAFELQENEFDISEIYEEPLPEVVDALNTYKTYDEMCNNFPDVK